MNHQTLEMFKPSLKVCAFPESLELFDQRGREDGEGGVQGRVNKYYFLLIKKNFLMDFFS